MNAAAGIRHRNATISHRRASYWLIRCARLNDATEETRLMRDALLFVLIAGVVVLAIGVDIGMVL
jgi:hypothetical protein